MLWEEVDNSFDISFIVWRFSSLGLGTTALILGLRPGQFLCVKPGGEIKKVRRKLKFHPTQLCLKTIILQKNFKKKEKRNFPWLKDRTQTKTAQKREVVLWVLALPSTKNYDPFSSLPLKPVAGTYTIFHHCSLSHQSASDRILAGKSHMLSVSHTFSQSPRSLLAQWEASVSPGWAPCNTVKL